MLFLCVRPSALSAIDKTRTTRLRSSTLSNIQDLRFKGKTMRRLILLALVVGTSLGLPAAAVSKFCPNGGVYYAEFDACLFIQKQRKTFDNAEAECMMRGGHLISLHSSYQATIINEIAVNELNQQYMWLGMYRTDKTKKQWYWTDGSDTQYKRWAPDEPYGELVHLAPLTGYWETVDKSEQNQFPFICKMSSGFAPSAGPWIACPPGWKYLSTTRSCYYGADFRNVGGIGYEDAATYCREMDATLTSIHGKEENYFVYSTVPGGDDAKSWIGLRFVNGTWKWEDNSPLDYTKWWQNQHKDLVIYAATMSIGPTLTGPSFWTSQSATDKQSYFVCKQLLPALHLNAESNTTASP